MGLVWPGWLLHFVLFFLSSKSSSRCILIGITPLLQYLFKFPKSLTMKCRSLRRYIVLCLKRLSKIHIVVIRARLDPFLPGQTRPISSHRHNLKSNGVMRKFEKILKPTGKSHNKQLYVKWLNWPNKFDSWISWQDIEDQLNNVYYIIHKNY
jgi:hypothetical protein